MNSIVLSNVSVSFGKRDVLKGINFEATEGKVKVISGFSGSGKSTLLRTISGVIPEVISAQVNGYVTPSSVRERKSILSYVPQEPWFSVVTPYVWSEIYSFSSRGYEDHIESMVRELGLDKLLYRTTFTLSAGELQRVAIASSVASGKSIILLDEPTSHLDPSNAGKVVSLVKYFKKLGVGFVITDHNLDLWRGLGDEFYYLNEGSLQNGIPSYYQEVSDELDSLSPPDPSEEVVLEVQVKEYRYPDSDRPILEDVSLNVRKGEIVAVVGPSGGGKSTLLRLIASRSRISSGTISVKAKGKIAYIPDNPLLFFSGPTLRKELENKENGLVKKFGLSHLLDTPIKFLSVGERRRAALLSALTREAKVILLDEPTVGLDPKNKLSVLETVASIAQRGVSFIIASHDPAVKRVSNEVLTIE